jgi:subtilisin-like proprotein convertase family protein
MTVRLSRCVLALAAIVTAPPAAAQELSWIELQPSAPGTAPTVEVVDSDGGLEISLDLAGFFVGETLDEGVAFTTLEIPEAGLAGADGTPYMPFRAVLLPLPHGPAVEVSAVRSTPLTVLRDVTVRPAQPAMPDCGSAQPEFVIDESAYSRSSLFPATAARIGDEFIVRGQRFAVLELAPLQFNPAASELIAHPRIEVRLSLEGAIDASAEEMKRRRGRSLFATTVDLEQGAGVPDSNPTGSEYLILAHDSFVDAIQPLADWKRRKGLTVEVVPISQVGGTSTQIKSWLQARYDSDPDLTYVLLVGDHQQVPSQDVGGMVTDLYYSCLDGGDYLPDVVLGRISVQTETDCANIVDKILTYERTPDSGSWHGDFLMAALLQDYNDYNCRADRWFFETGTHAMHFARDVAGMGILTAATSDSLSCNPYWFRSDSYPHRFPGYAGQPVPAADAALITTGSTATQDVTDAINTGVSIVQHRDHGSVTGWGDPHYSNSNIAALSNGTRTPVVFSVNCLTGAFDGSSDCFVEAFMKKYPGGAVGAIGATDLSYSGYNDLIVHGVYDCFWDDYDTADGGNVYPHSFRPAEAFIYGKYYMYHWEGSGGLTQLEFELFHWHGDPEMRVFTAAPGTPTVSVDGPIPAGASELTVNCSVDGALVAVTEDGNLLGRATVDGGSATITLDPAPQSPTTLDVVVTGHNMMPWEGNCEVIVPVGPWLVYRSHAIDDSGGNADGVLNPGEAVVLPVTVENVGAQAGTGLSAILTDGSPACTMTDPTAGFPDAGIGELVQTLPDHFALVLDPSAVHGDMVPFELAWTADGGWSGSTGFAITVCDPLVLSDVSVGAPSHQGTVVTWTTNMPATSVVHYGTASPPGEVQEDLTLTTDHVVELSGLDACTDYVLSVTSANPGCYEITDDNGGDLYRFTTTSGRLITVDSSDPARIIPDALPAGLPSLVTVDSPYAAVDVDVLVNITHPSTDQIDLYLIGPDGTSVELSTDNGGSGDNFIDTVFDDDAAQSITAASPPFTGSFRPEQPLSALNGRPVQGSWTLHVADDTVGQMGMLNGWQLRVRIDEPCGALFEDGFESGDTAAWSAAVP